MRPVLRQVCQYVWLLDGSIGLVDIARMNDALTANDENQYRAQQALVPRE